MAKYLGMPRASDVRNGIRVRSTRAMGNQFARIPSNTGGIIEGDTNKDGYITVLFDPCACCGVQVRISHLKWDDLELERQNPEAGHD